MTELYVFTALGVGVLNKTKGQNGPPAIIVELVATLLLLFYMVQVSQK